MRENSFYVDTVKVKDIHHHYYHYYHHHHHHHRHHHHHHHYYYHHHHHHIHYHEHHQHHYRYYRKDYHYHQHYHHNFHHYYQQHHHTLLNINIFRLFVIVVMIISYWQKNGKVWKKRHFIVWYILLVYLSFCYIIMMIENYLYDIDYDDCNDDRDDDDDCDDDDKHDIYIICDRWSIKSW